MRCVLGAGIDKLRDEAYAKTVIAEMGGLQKLAEGMREYHELVVRMRSEYAELIEMYPNRWVAMGKNGVLAVGTSMNEVLEEIERQGVDSGEAVVEFLDTDPPVLIL